MMCNNFAMCIYVIQQMMRRFCVPAITLRRYSCEALPFQFLGIQFNMYVLCVRRAILHADWFWASLEMGAFFSIRNVTNLLSSTYCFLHGREMQIAHTTYLLRRKLNHFAQQPIELVSTTLLLNSDTNQWLLSSKKYPLHIAFKVYAILS